MSIPRTRTARCEVLVWTSVIATALVSGLWRADAGDRFAVGAVLTVDPGWTV
jgi:hypothetical protein